MGFWNDGNYRLVPIRDHEALARRFRARNPGSFPPARMAPNGVFHPSRFPRSP